VGLELQGCAGVGWDRVNFTAYLATGILFHNKTAGDFTEMCSGQCDLSAVTAIEYRRTSGDESFHGSGLTGRSTIAQPSAAALPSILIGAGCRVYNAPLSANLWAYTTTQPLIRNNGEPCDYHGSLQMELMTITTALLVDAASANAVTYAGDYRVFNESTPGVTLGPFSCAAVATAALASATLGSELASGSWGLAGATTASGNGGVFAGVGSMSSRLFCLPLAITN
jgi:hypothetical protein